MVLFQVIHHVLEIGRKAWNSNILVKNQKNDERSDTETIIAFYLRGMLNWYVREFEVMHGTDDTNYKQRTRICLES